MSQISVGTMMRQMRKEKSISQKVLGFGLCSEAALSKYENGERMPDVLLFHCLMQRLGIAPEDFSIMMVKKEYYYYLWKDMVQKAIRKKDWEEVNKLSACKEAEDYTCNKKIQLQFYYYLQAILAEKCQNERKKALQFLKRAIEETVPDFLDGKLEDYRFSLIELQLIALYFYKGTLIGEVGQEKAYFNFKTLLYYTEHRILDEREKVRVLPGIVGMMINACREFIVKEERIALEAGTLDLLKRGRILCHLPEIARLYIQDLKITGVKQINKYETQYGDWSRILDIDFFNMSFQPEDLFDSRPNIYLVSEYLYSYRSINEMTQDQVSDGICTTETYSRLETGKRFPQSVEYMALLERLGISWGYFKGEIETTDYHYFELRQRQRQFIIARKWKEAAYILEKMKFGIDMQDIGNNQYINMMSNLIEFETGKITIEQFYERDMELLKLTVSKERIEKAKLYYFTNTEIELCNHIANILEKLGEPESAMKLLNWLMEQIQKSAINVEYWWWRGMGTTIFNISNILLDSGKCGQALEFIKSYLEKFMNIKTERKNVDNIIEDSISLKKSDAGTGKTCNNKQVFELEDFFSYLQKDNIKVR